MAPSEVVVCSFVAGLYGLDEASHEWVLSVPDAIHVHVFMDDAGLFRVVGWVEATGDVVVKHAITRDCIWLDVNEYFAQMTNAADVTYGLAFTDPTLATEASNAVRKILSRLQNETMRDNNLLPAIAIALELSSEPVSPTSDLLDMKDLPVVAPLLSVTTPPRRSFPFAPPSPPQPSSTRIKRSASVPQPGAPLVCVSELRRGSFPLAMPPLLDLSLPPSSSASRNSSRRQSLASFEEVEHAATAAIDATTTPPKPALEPVPRDKPVQYPSCILPEDAHISRPYQMRQEVHVTFNAELARYEGLPTAWRSLNKQFGLPIDAVPKRKVDGYDAKIPAVLQMMREYLVQNGGLETEGIFRLAPDKEACSAVKEAMNNGVFAGCNDVHIIANLIKVWFRELPESLLNVIPEKRIYQVCGVTDPSLVLDVLRDVPTSQRSVILWLLDLMAAVVLREKQTKMSAKNMAIVLSPNLFSIASDNPMVALTMSQKVAEFTTVLLKARLIVHHGYTPRA
ncbi:hypothetical protein SPRG_04134 [Saprolegnia parasitica CBS 223.65]|uniref:Rho-GAP domain-containing protein n=1 Tax=Saprolegnia parasitica (strain CBS 223.65) TaxID=695850 RepID=A0A067CWN0_SAPPC|nr:hypothetical protein SPRG_04134 [Saprolegnia parasitica CBS 223.65]KDO30946.1 hypothetical protein SPRG_04134 [Saprolegnia parasitica CBS 223.65]|eukprot:XP_012198130.1 hypothetical protein SPRG_04134 [Saprolegnia parasitica CBS 223.65]